MELWGSFSIVQPFLFSLEWQLQKLLSLGMQLSMVEPVAFKGDDIALRKQGLPVRYAFKLEFDVHNFHASAG